MNRFWNPRVEKLSPYVPGEQPKAQLVKLNTNENPYGPSPAVAPAIAAATGQLHLYPDPESSELRQILADLTNLTPQQVFVGNGSDEVLAHCFAGLSGASGRLAFPDISYSFYPVWAQLCGLNCVVVPLAADFTVDPGSMPEAVDMLVVPNPNAPTGVALDIAGIERLLSDAPNRLLVVDEAYVDFGAESATTLISDHANLLVVQTLSKSRSLAGLRVGMAYGQEPLIEALNRVKNSFNSYPLDALAQAGAAAALQDIDWFEATRNKVIASRERLTLTLAERGFEVLPSKANFLFVRHRQQQARQLFGQLREQGILVRYFDKPRIDNFLRITIGTDQQCDALINAIDRVLGGEVAEQI